MLYIFRTNCPLTNDEWNRRAKEVCKSEPKDYHCMYNTSCKLEEFCDEKEKNYFRYYLRADSIFSKEERRDMTTNSMDYWYIQYFLYCKNILITEKPMISSTTGLPSTTGQPSTTCQPCTTCQPSITCDNQENDYLIPFICVIVVAIVLLCYILRNRILSLAKRGYSICFHSNENNETPTETGKKMEYKKPTEETDYNRVPGRTGRIGNGRRKRNGSQNSDLMKNLTN